MNSFTIKLLQDIKRAAATLQSNIESPDESYDSLIDKIKKYFAFIDEKADLDINKSSGYFDKIKESFQKSDDTGWNESLKNLFKIYTDLYDSVEGTTEIDTASAKPNGRIVSSKTNGYNQTFNTKDLIDGDAGNSFAELGQWVKPWYNTDLYEDDIQHQDWQQSYSYVRLNDKCKDALTDEKNLQFTRAQELAQKLRLLMPKNTRRVEIEDLNRNFWVIAQVISGISAYIYGPESSYYTLFKAILNELFQLWENALYLWVATCSIIAPNAEDCVVDFFFMPTSVLKPYKKYDDIDISIGSITKNLVKERCEYQQKKYPNSNLILFPYIRFENYQKNYFKKLYVPYMCIYNRASEEWHLCELKCNDKMLCFDAEEYRDSIYGVRDNEMNYTYLYPLTYAQQKYERGGAHRYFGAVRVHPSVQYTVQEGIIYIQSIIFNLTDGSEHIINKIYGRHLASYTSEEGKYSENTGNINFICKKDSRHLEFIDTTVSYLQGGAYLGEMPSFWVNSNTRYTYELEENNLIDKAYMVKIGNFLASGLEATREGSLESVIASGTFPEQSVYNKWTYQPIKRDYSEQDNLQPINQVLNLLYKYDYQSYPYSESYELYYPSYENGEIIVKSAGPRESITFSDMKDLAKTVLKDFLENNLTLPDDNNFKVKDFPYGIEDSTTGIVYLLALIGIEQEGGSPGLTCKHSFACALFRYVPSRLREDITPIRERDYTDIYIDGYQDAVGYLEYVQDINRTLSNADDYVGWFSSNGYLQKKFVGEEDISQYVAVKVGSTTRYFRPIDLPPEIKEKYDMSYYPDKIVLDYLERFDSGRVIQMTKGLININQDLKKKPSFTLSDYDRNSVQSGNIDSFSEDENFKQIVKLKVDYVSQGGSYGSSYKMKPLDLWCRKSTDSYNLKSQEKLYSSYKYADYTAGGADEGEMYYKWTGAAENAPGLTYNQILSNTNSLTNSQHFNSNWKGEN